MSGHNKWSKVKHRKEAVDSKKSKIFSDLAKDITLMSREVKGDVSSPRLRSIIEKARQYNMPKENIDRAVQKGLGANAEDREAVLYEVYGPGGSAILIETETDSTNRTLAELKQILSKFDLELAAPGSALWAFVKIEGVWTAQAPLSINDADSESIQKIRTALLNHPDVTEITTNALI
jgi:YebC/PmpR family DNA-binding regulatory protein